MSDCCTDKECAIEALQARQGRTLRIVLAINVVMFLVELVSGLFARSTALLVWATDSGWPDIAVGLALAALFLRSALNVSRSALLQLRQSAV